MEANNAKAHIHHSTWDNQLLSSKTKQNEAPGRSETTQFKVSCKNKYFSGVNYRIPYLCSFGTFTTRCAVDGKSQSIYQ